MLADELIRKRTQRAIAIVLNVKEREVDSLLKGVPGGDRASKMLRKVVLDQFNDLADLACDVATSGEAAKFWFNDELWQERLNQIYDKVVSDGVDPPE